MTKRNKIIYWVATGLLAIGMLQSGIFALLRSKDWVDLVTDLGYPGYILTIIGVWKILGVIAILIPRYPLIKEWAYAGFFFVMTGALVSHLFVGINDAKAIAGPFFQIVFIMTSWYFRQADRKIIFTNQQTKHEPESQVLF
ncbi:MAG: DoxX family protein [Chitinophagaceae bacterium]